METTKKEEQKEPTPFCDVLMDVTGGVGILADENDCAIVMCANERTLNVRMKGRYDQHVNMLLNKMKNDTVFADMIMETVKFFMISQEQEKETKIVDINGHEEEKELES